MVRVDIRLTEEQKVMLKEISAADNRSLTNMIIKLIEDRYRTLVK